MPPPLPPPPLVATNAVAIPADDVANDVATSFANFRLCRFVVLLFLLLFVCALVCQNTFNRRNKTVLFFNFPFTISSSSSSISIGA